MSTKVNSAGFGTSAGRSMRTTIGSNAQAFSGIQSVSRQSSTTKKKQLNYNEKEISSQLLRASKARSASTVLARAKTKVSTLKRCLGTGQYNDNEVRVAIAHATRMVRCAQLKVRNLKEEEQLKKKNDSEHTSEERQKKSEIKRRAHQKEQNLKTKAALKENQQILKETTAQKTLQQKRKMHRREEYGKICEADMKYLKEKTEGCGQSIGGVFVDLSAQAVSLSELQLSEHALQMIEDMAEQDVELEMEAIAGSDTATDSSSMGIAGSTVVTAEIPATVDILI